MFLRLTRTHTNRTTCQGILTLDNTQLSLHTLEGAIRETGKQVGAAIPFGTYNVTLAQELLSYRGRNIRALWPTLQRIPWFPSAQFQTQGLPRRGRILIGTHSTPSAIEGAEEAMRQLSLALQEEYENDPAQTVELIVEKSPDFIYTPLSLADMQRLKRIEEEKKAKMTEQKGFE